MPPILNQVFEAYTSGVVFFPEDGHKALVASDQL
jgi:hypothetical protein